MFFRSKCGLFTGLGALRAVLRATLTASVHTGGVECTAHQVITHTGEVLHTAAAHQHDRVLLQVVAFARDVGVHLLAVGQTHTCYLTHRRVRLLGSRRVHARTYAPALRTCGQCRRLRLVYQARTTVSH